MEFANLPEREAKQGAHQQSESKDGKSGDRCGGACVDHAGIRHIVRVSGRGRSSLPASIGVIELGSIVHSVAIRIETGKGGAPDYGAEGASRRGEEILFNLGPEGISRTARELRNVTGTAVVHGPMRDLCDPKGACIGLPVDEEQGKERRKNLE